MISVFFSILSTICLMVGLLIAVAYFTHAERKILGAEQRRRGPNVIRVFSGFYYNFFISSVFTILLLSHKNVTSAFLIINNKL
jgi:hypothetical protein